MSRLRPVAVLIGFALVTLPLMPVQQLFVWFSPRLARLLPMYYHRMVARIIGLRIEVEGDMARAGPALVVSNHVSWLDIVILSSVAPLSFVAKRQVGGWPFFGSLARLQRTVFVDRDSRQATGASRDEMRERLASGDILVLFPEGTSHDGIRVLPFKSSFFAAAEAPGVVVQPVTIALTGHRNMPMNRRTRPFYAWYGDMDLLPHLWQAIAMGPLEARVVCHAGLALSGETNRKMLARHAEHVVRHGLVAALHGPRKIG